MNVPLRDRRVASAVASAIAGAASATVFAQNAADESSAASAGSQPLEEVVVTGIRASLRTAQELKRDSETVQDSIIAEDIGKLPDVTATEALQRVTGVQIGRDLGEGGGTVSIGGSAVNSGIEIRGLPQVETTLDGREVFTSTGSRVLNFEDVPAALLAGIDVYKEPTANLLEGGIGGTVDLRTRKPFDFPGLMLQASGAERFADLSGRTKPELTALASNRWETAAGEIGALLSFAYQDRPYRQYAANENAPGVSATAIPGQSTFLPGGVFNLLIDGERRRTGLHGVIQWQARSDLQLYAQVASHELKSQQAQYVLYTPVTPAMLAARSVTTFPGTTDANHASYNNAPADLFDSFRAVTDVNRQYALNARWTPGRVTVTGDASYTRASEVLVNPTLVAASTAPSLTQTLTLSGIPQTHVVGVDLTNLASYGGGTLAANENHYRGDEQAYRVDVEYAVGAGILKSISSGARFANRTLQFRAVRFSQPVTGTALQRNPQLFGRLPFGTWYSATESLPVQPDTLAVDIGQLQYNFDGVRQELGVTANKTLAVGSSFDAQEKNTALYVRVNFEGDQGIPFDGNVGVRFVRVQDFLNGFATGAVPNVFVPVYFSNGRTQSLPSLNLRFSLTSHLQARLAASKVVTQPDFSQLAPSFNLIPASGLATGGNPHLKPTRADQVDGTLEWYFGPASSLYGALFYKKVKDFIFQNTVPNVVIDGLTYNVTGPLNGGDGTIRGVEIGYQQFFDFLPGVWSGLGAQLNYTYVDAVAPTAVAGVTTTLPGLSRNSFNLVGLYEKGGLSMRVAYNWRGQFYQTVYSGNTAVLSNNPIFFQQYGWLDASVSYDITPDWSVFAQGSNLLRTRLHTFYGVRTRPDMYSIDDRQYVLGMRIKLH
jgi:TonB-dependent receptor